MIQGVHKDPGKYSKSLLLLITTLLLMGCETMSINTIESSPLPNYVVVNLEKNQNPEILRQVAKSLIFPLSEEDLIDIQILEAKFDGEENCAGLSAPQIGISKKVMIFAAPDNPDLKKFRPDFTQSMDKAIWINPSYQPIGKDMHEDYEGCFSVENVAGLVNRHKKIRYRAQSISGEFIEGDAEGFLARIIQHETDHLNGKLFIDLVPKDKLMTLDEYRKMRAAAMTSTTE